MAHRRHAQLAASHRQLRAITEPMNGFLHIKRFSLPKRSPVFLLLLSVWAVASAVPRTTPGAQELLVLSGATLIDGTGVPPVTNAVVIVKEGRIVRAGPKQQIEIPTAGRIRDVSGKWIIPGLIDTHVHLFGSSGLYARPDIYDLRASRPYQTEIRRVQQRVPFTFSRYLCAGVTSVVSLGGPQWDFQVRQQALQAMVAPRVAVAGPFLSLPGPENLWTPQDPDLIPVKTPKEARVIVQQLRVQEPNLLKTGFLPSSTYTLSDYLPILEAIIDEGHSQGLRVAVHTTDLKAATAAVQAGADVLAHTVFDRRVDDAFLQMVTKREVVTLTTLGIWQRLLAVLTQDVNLLDIEHTCGDPQSIASWAEIARISHAEKPPIPDWVSLTPLWRTTMLTNIKRLHEAGALIAVGSDSGNIGTLHGPSFHRELQLLAEAGLSPMAILIAATSHGARVLGRASELGTIEPGKLADLVILNADPLKNVHNMSKIHAVLKEGTIFEHSALTATKP